MYRYVMYYIFDVYLFEFFLLLSWYPPQSEHPGYFNFIGPVPIKVAISKVCRDALTKHVFQDQKGHCYDR